MIVVSNTTPLIGLATIQRFDLLRQLFGKIYIAQAVYDEAVTAGREEGGAKHEVSTATWIETVPVKDQLAVEVLLDELDRGEAETIVLARELGADWVLMDEKKGRRKVTELGFDKIGTMEENACRESRPLEKKRKNVQEKTYKTQSAPPAGQAQA
jgi:predicted nucleic acid-binding protein